MGYRIIADLAGLNVKQKGATVAISDARWHGFLSNIAPSEFEERFVARLPESIAGAAFLERYGGTTDRVTRIEPPRIYNVRVPAAHAVYENFRVRTFAETLRDELKEKNELRRELLGELMYQSHASYSACGLGSAGTDLLVALIRAKGKDRGLYGAKITGGGSGGTVAVLGRLDAGDVIAEVAHAYAKASGHEPYIFSGSSPGSAAFGHLRLQRTNIS
jgi:galactokinase